VRWQLAGTQACLHAQLSAGSRHRYPSWCMLQHNRRCIQSGRTLRRLIDHRLTMQGYANV
jgi:hypothetical protein